MFLPRCFSEEGKSGVTAKGPVVPVDRFRRPQGTCLPRVQRGAAGPGDPVGTGALPRRV